MRRTVALLYHVLHEFVVGLVEMSAGILSWCIVTIGGVSMTTGALIFCFQIYALLRYGEWRGLSLADGIDGIGGKLSEGWPYQATDWLGIASVAQFLLDKAPLTLTLFVVVPLALMVPLTIVTHRLGLRGWWE